MRRFIREDDSTKHLSSEDLFDYCTREGSSRFSKEEKEAILSHLFKCEECSKVLDLIKQTDDLFDDSVINGYLNAIPSKEQCEREYLQYIIEEIECEQKPLGNRRDAEVIFPKNEHFPNDCNPEEDAIYLYKQKERMAETEQQQKTSDRGLRSWVVNNPYKTLAASLFLTILGVTISSFLGLGQNNTPSTATPVLNSSSKDTKTSKGNTELPLEATVTPLPNSCVPSSANPNDNTKEDNQKVAKQNGNKIDKDQKEMLHAKEIFTAPNSEFLSPLPTLVKKTEVYLTNLTNFKITEQTLQKLELEGLPNDTLEKLGSLTDQEIKGKKAFLNKLKTTIGEEQAVKFGSLILKRSTSDNLNDNAVKFLEGFEYGLGELNIRIAEDENRNALLFRIGTPAGTGLFLSVGTLSSKEIEVTDKTAYEEGKKYAEVVAASVHSDNQSKYLREHLDNPQIDSKMKKASADNSGNYSIREKGHIYRLGHRSFKLERADREES